jgi:hypothetical protein
VILVAVTLVIAIGVIGWIMGWWGAIGATESLIVYADSKLYDDGTVELHIANKGSAAAVIYKVEIVGIGDERLTPEKTLTPGQDDVLTAQIDTQGKTIVAGSRYVVKVYTKAGNVYQVTLTAEKKA